MHIVLLKYFSTKQAPVKGSTWHFPIPVASQSQLNAPVLQNYAESQLSIFRKAQPLFLPQVTGSAKEKLTDRYHPVELNRARVNLLIYVCFLLEAIIY
jgi:hypothetical protein